MTHTVLSPVKRIEQRRILLYQEISAAMSIFFCVNNSRIIPAPFLEIIYSCDIY